MRRISREQCRRLVLPALIKDLSVIGNPWTFERCKDHIRISLKTHYGQEVQLKFSDEDIAARQDYVIIDDDVDNEEGEIDLCSNADCQYGCGCGCIKDWGYLSTGMTSKGENPGCSGIHSQELRPINEEEIQFCLNDIHAMTRDLIAHYICSVALAASVE